MARIVGCVPCRGFLSEAFIRIFAGLLTFTAVGMILKSLNKKGPFDLIKEINK